MDSLRQRQRRHVDTGDRHDMNPHLMNIKNLQENMGTVTYRAKGLIEWRVALDAGGATLTVDFTGGCMSANGLVAGKYETSNRAIQAIIESSGYFRDGLIVRATPREEPAPCESAVTPAARAAWQNSVNNENDIKGDGTARGSFYGDDTAAIV